MRPGLHKSAVQTSFIARYLSKYLARKFCNNLETRRAPQQDSKILTISRLSRVDSFSFVQ